MERNAVLLVILAAALLSTSLAMPLLAQTCPNLVWSDEFDGSAVDLNKWEPMIGDGCDFGICGWGNNEEQYYKAENATVANGLLTITAKEERVRGKKYTSARLRTINLADFDEGYFEGRIRLPVGQGMWSAFWMLSTDEIYGGWPQSGEIDIMENVGHEESTVHGTIHYGQLYPNNSFQGTSYSLANGERFTDGFHTFAVEKTTDQIRWFVDGVLYQTKTPADVAPENWPFNERFHFLLNLAVGGNWPGSPDATTVFPQTMDVDYVRVYDAGKPFITGDAIVSNQASGVVYAVGNSGGGSISWTVPSDATIVSGQGTSSITVDFGNDSGDVTATISSCGGTVLSRSVTVDAPLFFEASFENFDDPENVTLGNVTGTLLEVANPAPSSVNGSANVGEYTRNPTETYDVLVYNTSLITDADSYLSRERQFFIDLYTGAPVGSVLLLQLEDSSSATSSNFPTGRHSRYQVQTSVQNAWERVELRYLDQPDASVATGDVDTMILLFEPNTQSGDTYYYDNLDSLTVNDPGTGGPVCGNSVAETGEDCDGGDLAGASCSSLGFDSGILACSSSCTFDTSSCSNDPGAVCGNGIAETGEDCDGFDLGGATCQSLGFDQGTLACGGLCGFDTSGCSFATCEPAGSGAPCTSTINCCSGVGNCSSGKPSSRTCL